MIAARAAAAPRASLSNGVREARKGATEESSQAVRLPKDYRFRGSEVAVKHFGNGVLLLPIDDPWQTLEDGLAAFEPGFVLERFRQ